jgi:hypothetical protein
MTEEAMMLRQLITGIYLLCIFSLLLIGELSKAHRRYQLGFSVLQVEYQLDFQSLTYDFRRRLAAGIIFSILAYWEYSRRLFAINGFAEKTKKKAAGTAATT